MNGYEVIISKGDSWFDLYADGSVRNKRFSIPVNVELYCSEGNVIGEIIGYYFKMSEMLNYGIDPLREFDGYSEGTYDLYEEVFNEEGKVKSKYYSSKHNIFYIEYLYIKREYRGKGIGTKLIINLDSYLNNVLNTEIGLYALKAYPIKRSNDGGYLDYESEDKEDKKSKLIEFYKNLGYSSIKNSDLMYINTDTVY